ncbi:hydroxymethylglutaryl-CoA reductase, degradative [Lentilactobacillus hilgardii]|uniref:hydroxymethylglutaryl-CoA reductase, degradative n=1 Tax=Lentilactobacillus hilgardii TaxID=1588 RepID=UPI0021A77754|nr:hydroxymethylglutaryl-CoA reductase, degradative [Lentilactobacillus hilgardii]MCT3400464.1 hydroxymethylglutaryl-CoA reductase, degradative [Lentilactobacillus hilgardii]
MDARWAHFYQKSYRERLDLIADFSGLNSDQVALLKTTNAKVFGHLIENYLADYALPEGIVTNMKVNNRQYLVPMVTEEPSVIAAASNGGKLLSGDMGIKASVKQRLLSGQIILKDISDERQLREFISDRQQELIEIANNSHPRILKHGGGAKSLSVRRLDPQFYSVDLQVDSGEAMGANLVNTMLEAVANELRSFGLQVTMAILSNYADKSLVHVLGKIPFSELTTSGITGQQVASQIVDASHIAQVDVYRATTHNKGIMNGIDAAVMATGNDWRAVESAAHAYAAKDGQYKGLSTWRVNQAYLIGEMTIPMPIGFVGGATSVLPMAAINKKITRIKRVREMMEVIGAIGLAQNLAALRVLVTDGIQKGHMNLQLKSLAMANGTKESELPTVVKQLRHMTSPDSTDVKKILKELRK